MGFVEFQSKDKYIKHHYSAREMLCMLSSSFSLIFLASLLRYSLLPRSLSLLGVKTFSLASIISVPNALSFDLTIVFKKRVKHLRKLFRYMSNHVRQNRKQVVSVSNFKIILKPVILSD